MYLFFDELQNTKFLHAMLSKAVAESGILVRFFYDGTKRFEVAQEKCPNPACTLRTFI